MKPVDEVFPQYVCMLLIQIPENLKTRGRTTSACLPANTRAYHSVPTIFSLSQTCLEIAVIPYALFRLSTPLIDRLTLAYPRPGWQAPPLLEFLQPKISRRRSSCLYIPTYKDHRPHHCNHETTNKNALPCLLACSGSHFFPASGITLPRTSERDKGKGRGYFV